MSSVWKLAVSEISDLFSTRKGVRQRAMRAIRLAFRSSEAGSPNTRELTRLRQHVPVLLMIAQNSGESTRARCEGLNLGCLILNISDIEYTDYLDECFLELCSTIIENSQTPDALSSAARECKKILQSTDDTATVGSTATTRSMGELISLKDLAEVSSDLREALSSSQATSKPLLDEIIAYLNGKSFEESEIRQATKFIQDTLRSAGAELLFRGEPAALYPRVDGRETGKINIIFGSAAKRQRGTTVFDEFTCRHFPPPSV